MYRIRWIATGVAGSPYYLNHYFAGIDAEGAAEALDGFYLRLANSMGSSVVLNSETEAVTIDPATGLQTGATPVAQYQKNGSETSNLLPTQVQGLAKFTTATVLGGRKIQGRMFIPGLVEEQVSDGATLGVTPRSELQQAFDFMLGEQLTAQWDWVVWSRKNGATAPIVGATVQSALATLRTRGVRG